MANLTIAIQDDLLRSARIRALEQGTSVNALLRDYLKAFAGDRTTQEQAIGDLLEISHSATSRRGDRTWSREDLHER